MERNEKSVGTLASLILTAGIAGCGGSSGGSSTHTPEVHYGETMLGARIVRANHDASAMVLERIENGNESYVLHNFATGDEQPLISQEDGFPIHSRDTFMFGGNPGREVLATTVEWERDQTPVQPITGEPNTDLTREDIGTYVVNMSGQLVRTVDDPLWNEGAFLTAGHDKRPVVFREHTSLYHHQDVSILNADGTLEPILDRVGDSGIERLAFRNSADRKAVVVSGSHQVYAWDLDTDTLEHVLDLTQVPNARQVSYASTPDAIVVQIRGQQEGYALFDKDGQLVHRFEGTGTNIWPHFLDYEPQAVAQDHHDVLVRVRRYNAQTNTSSSTWALVNTTTDQVTPVDTSSAGVDYIFARSGTQVPGDDVLMLAVSKNRFPGSSTTTDPGQMYVNRQTGELHNLEQDLVDQLPARPAPVGAVSHTETRRVNYSDAETYGNNALVKIYMERTGSFSFGTTTTSSTTPGGSSSSSGGGGGYQLTELVPVFFEGNNLHDPFGSSAEHRRVCGKSDTRRYVALGASETDANGNTTGQFHLYDLAQSTRHPVVRMESAQLGQGHVEFASGDESLCAFVLKQDDGRHHMHVYDMNQGMLFRDVYTSEDELSVEQVCGDKRDFIVNTERDLGGRTVETQGVVELTDTRDDAGHLGRHKGTVTMYD